MREFSPTSTSQSPVPLDFDNYFSPEMNSKDFPLEYFYDESITNFYVIFTNITTGITVALVPIYFYVIYTRSKDLGSFKWFMLNYSVWFLCLDIALCYSKPLILNPAAAGVVLGPLRESGNHTTSIIFILLVCILGGCSVGGASVTLAYRYAGLFPGMISTIFASKGSLVVYFLLHLGSLSFVGVMSIQFFLMKREDIISDALEYSPVLEKFTSEFTFMFLNKDIIKGGMITAFYALIFITCLIIVVMILLLYKLYHMKTTTWTSKTQKNLLISGFGQVTITFGLLFCPILMFISAMIYDTPYSGPRFMIVLCGMSLHAMIEMITTMCFVSPYRRFFVKLFNKLLRKTGTESHMTSKVNQKSGQGNLQNTATLRT